VIHLVADDDTLAAGGAVDVLVVGAGAAGLLVGVSAAGSTTVELDAVTCAGDAVSLTRALGASGVV
jgi:hypothetical protein